MKRLYANNYILKQLFFVLAFSLVLPSLAQPVALIKDARWFSTNGGNGALGNLLDNDNSVWETPTVTPTEGYYYL